MTDMDVSSFNAGSRTAKNSLSKTVLSQRTRDNGFVCARNNAYRAQQQWRRNNKRQRRWYKTIDCLAALSRGRIPLPRPYVNFYSLTEGKRSGPPSHLIFAEIPYFTPLLPSNLNIINHHTQPLLTAPHNHPTMATANAAFALAGVLGSYVVPPVAQKFLPSFLQQLLRMQSPTPATAGTPFRVRFLPTRTGPQDAGAKAFFGGITRAIDTKTISSVPENLPAVALGITPMVPTNIHGIPVTNSITAIADFTPPATRTFSPLVYVANSTPAGEWTKTIASALIIFLLCALAMILFTNACSIYKYATHGLDAHELDEIKDTLSSTFSPLKTCANYVKRAFVSVMELQKKLKDTQAELDRAKEASSEEVRKLQKALEASRNREQEAKKSAQDLKTTQADETACKSAGEISKLKNDLAAATKGKDEALKTANDHEKTKKLLGESLVDAGKAEQCRDKAEKQAKAAVRAKDKAEKDAEALRNEIETLKEKLNQSQGAEKESKDQIQDLLGKVKQSEDNMRSTEEWWTHTTCDLKRDLKDATQKTRDLEQELPKLQVENGRLEGRCKNLTTQLEDEKTAKDQRGQQLNSVKQELADAKSQISKFQLEKIETEGRCEGLNDELEFEKSARAKADANHEQDLDEVCAKALAQSEEFSAEIDHLKDENEKLQSRLNKACRCKRTGDSTSDKGDGDDGNDDDQPGGDGNTGGGEGADAEDTARHPEPDNQPGGGAANDGGPSADFTDGEPQSSQSPDDADQATGEDSAGKEPQPLEPDELDDGSTPQGQDPHADSTAGDLDSADQGGVGEQDDGDSDADETAQVPRVKLPTASSSQGQMLFVRPPGFYNMPRALKRRYERKWGNYYRQSGSTQWSHAQLAPLLAQYNQPAPARPAPAQPAPAQPQAGQDQT